MRQSILIIVGILLVLSIVILLTHLGLKISGLGITPEDQWYYAFYVLLLCSMAAYLWWNRTLITRGLWELPLPYLGGIFGLIMDQNLRLPYHMSGGMIGIAIGLVISGLSLHLRWRRWVRSLPRENQETSGKEAGA